MSIRDCSTSICISLLSLAKLPINVLSNLLQTTKRKCNSYDSEKTILRIARDWKWHGCTSAPRVTVEQNVLEVLLYVKSVALANVQLKFLQRGHLLRGLRLFRVQDLQRVVENLGPSDRIRRRAVRLVSIVLLGQDKVAGYRVVGAVDRRVRDRLAALRGRRDGRGPSLVTHNRA